MRRAAFLAAGAAVCLLPSRLPAAPAIDLAACIDAIPGVTGVEARTMGDGPPVVALRADEHFAAASVIKLAIMTTVFRAYDAGTAHPSDEIPTRAEDLIGGSDVLSGTPPGRLWRLDALVDAMIRVTEPVAA